MSADGSADRPDRQAERQADPPPDLERLISQRCAEYLQLWEGAAAKFSRSAYRSEDLIDDWFALCGKAVRDITAGTALLWGAGGRSVPPQDPSPAESRATGSAEP